MHSWINYNDIVLHLMLITSHLSLFDASDGRPSNGFVPQHQRKLVETVRFGDQAKLDDGAIWCLMTTIKSYFQMK